MVAKETPKTLQSITIKIPLTEVESCPNCSKSYTRPRILYLTCGYTPESRTIVWINATIGRNGENTFAETATLSELVNLAFDLGATVQEVTKILQGVKSRWFGINTTDHTPSSIADAIGNSMRIIQKGLDNNEF